MLIDAGTQAVLLLPAMPRILALEGQSHTSRAGVSCRKGWVPETIGAGYERKSRRCRRLDKRAGLAFAASKNGSSHSVSKELSWEKVWPPSPNQTGRTY